MAASTGMAKSANRLGNGRTDRTGSLPLTDSGPDMDRSAASGGAVAVPAAGPAAGVEVANSKDGAAQSLEWDKSANLHVRMMRAQAQAKALEKTQAEGEGAKFLKNGFVSHEVVTHEAVRILTRNGVHFAHYLKDFSQDGNRTVVRTEGVFTNVDNPEERLVFPGFGYGVDSSDKGPGKGMSYSKKMILSQALMLSTHEDIENHNTQYEPTVQHEEVKKAEAITDAAVKTWADAFKRALDGCPDQKTLKRIRAENSGMMKNAAVPEVTREYFANMIAQLESDLP